jgi:LacI family transcriptional regulator
MAGMKNRPIVSRSDPPRRSVLLAQTWWEDRVLRGVAAYAAEHNWELQCRMHWTRQLPRRGEWRGDGIIAFTGTSRRLRPESKLLIDFVRAARVPVVQTQAFGDPFRAPKVLVSHEEIGRMAAEYFLGLNFRHLGYVAFDENPLEAARRRGFRRAAEEGGAIFHSLTFASFRRGIAQLPRPMSLLAVNDLNALDVMRTCRDAGFRVPEEFAVMGIDDTTIVCDLAAIPLTSIDCNHERQGFEAAALLDRLMSGRRAPVTPIIIPPRGVTVRRSTDILAIPDLGAARMLAHLRQRFRERLSVQQFAAELGLPLRRTHDHFHAHVGRTMLQELTRLRVEHAKGRLRDSKLKVEAVALESGFSNRFHFVNAFRRVTGQTPTTFRRKERSPG